MIGKTNIKIKPNKKVQYVEYIESTGTQYIDTGIKDYSKVVLDFTPLAETATCVYFGAQGTGSIPICPISLWRFYSSSKFSIIVGQSTQQEELSISVNKDYLLEATANAGTLTTIVNGTTSTLSYSTAPSTTLIAYLFALNNNGTAGNFSHMRCRSAKFYSSDGTLLRDFKPAKSEDGRLCLFDKVERKYYYNKGTGSFIGDGYEPTKLNYLESTGTQYIDTGIEITPTNFMDLKMELDMTVLSQTSSTAIMGISGTDIDVYVGIKSTKWYYGNGLTDVNTNVASDYLRHTHIYDVYNLTYTRDDTEIQMSLQSPKSTGTIRLFSYDSDGTNTIRGKFQLHKAKFYMQNKLIKEYIPVIDYTGVKCLYETVSKTYVYNNGTGTFGGA